MDKKFIFLLTAFLGLAALHVYDMFMMHKAIRQVRKEAWFDSHSESDFDIIDIKYCLQHLEARIEQYHGSDPDYSTGYPIWEKKRKEKHDPLIEYLIDKCI